jgi:hypothetical protein
VKILIRLLSSKSVPMSLLRIFLALKKWRKEMMKILKISQEKIKTITNQMEELAWVPLMKCQEKMVFD